jgi:chromatin assembly factor 1 subunit A
MSVENDLVPSPSRKRSAPEDDDAPAETPAKMLKSTPESSALSTPARSPSIVSSIERPVSSMLSSSAVAASAVTATASDAVAQIGSPANTSIADKKKRRSKAEIERERAEKDAEKDAKRKEREEKKRKKDEEDQQKKLERDAKLKAKEEEKRAKDDEKKAKEEEKQRKAEEKEKKERVILLPEHNSTRRRIANSSCIRINSA